MNRCCAESRPGAAPHTEVIYPPCDREPVRLLCLDCPRPQLTPPYLAFAFRSHVKVHRQSHPSHRIVWWCYSCRQFEDASEVLA